MKTLVLETLIKQLVPMFILFALYMFFRGHDSPGGGFIAGLIAVVPIMIHAIAYSPEETQRIYKLKPVFMAATGLLLAGLSGTLSMLKGQPFMSALWSDYVIPLIGKVGTPIIFDLGVFLIVSGMVLKVTFLFSERDNL